MNYLGNILRYAVIFGFLAFLVGFIGPIILTPDANQGPLLGIFITGPLGFILGGVYGAVVTYLKRSNS